MIHRGKSVIQNMEIEVEKVEIVNGCYSFEQEMIC